MARKLSESFLQALKSGFLSGLTQQVVDDPDLDLEIRDNSINIYYKGNSLLKLSEVTPVHYKAAIHRKFSAGLEIPASFRDQNTTSAFLACIPVLKQNIIRYNQHSLETEYEQLIVRANNYEPRNNSEYFFVDRQYTVPAGRFDLTGIFWEKARRRKHQIVAMCLVEVKFALNKDIANVQHQLQKYYDAIKPIAASIAQETETVFRQKLELGLYRQSPERVAAMKTLSIGKEISQFQFVLLLVDYNPNSSLLYLDRLNKLPFASQVKVFFGGFAMWQQNVRPLSRY